MGDLIYETITGRKLDLGKITSDERKFLSAVHSKYQREPKWADFVSWWMTQFRNSKLPMDSVVYRICQDLEARLGIAEKRVGLPDYRDYLADLIEERYGSRYRFCKETGIDPGHLSRVLAERSEMSLQLLDRVLSVLGAKLVVQSRESVYARISPQTARRVLAAAAM